MELSSSLSCLRLGGIHQGTEGGAQDFGQEGPNDEAKSQQSV